MTKLIGVVPVTEKHYDGMYGLFSKYSKIVHCSPKIHEELPTIDKILEDLEKLLQWRERVKKGVKKLKEFEDVQKEVAVESPSSLAEGDVEKLKEKVKTFEDDFSEVADGFDKFQNKINSVRKDFSEFKEKFAKLYRNWSKLFKK